MELGLGKVDKGLGLLGPPSHSHCSNSSKSVLGISGEVKTDLSQISVSHVSGAERSPEGSQSRQLELGLTALPYA